MGKIISNGINYSGLINAQGVFIDTNNVIYSNVTSLASESYTATEDCYIMQDVVCGNSQVSTVQIDGVTVAEYFYPSSTFLIPYTVLLKKGQILSVTHALSTLHTVNVYGIQQGSTSGLIDYSTNEQYTGQHWIDGKPIYQKTWDFESSGFEVGYDQWVDTNILSSGFDRIVGVEAIAPTKAVWGWVSATSDNTYVQLWQTRSTSIKIQYLTLKYTKASS